MQFFSAAPVAALAQEVPEHAAAMSLVQPIECGGVTGLPGEHDGFVRGGVVRVVQQHARSSMGRPLRCDNDYSGHRRPYGSATKPSAAGNGSGLSPGTRVRGSTPSAINDSRLS